MNVTTLLALTLSLTASAIGSQSMEVQPIRASVTMEDGRCIFWTGDNGMDANEFRMHLAQIQAKQSIIISHADDAPDRCVVSARRAAKNAGFKRVSVELDNDEAGPIGPPIIVR